MTVSGAWISHKKTGSKNLGLAVRCAAYMTLLPAGIIWPPPLWMESEIRLTSTMFVLTPLVAS